MRTMKRATSVFSLAFVALLIWSGVAGAQSWLTAPKPPRAFNAGSVALQLTDGTIMVQENMSSTWWKLTPDINGDYNTGTWSELAQSKAFDTHGNIVDYAPSEFASAVLPDGRVIVMGGEYLADAGVTGEADTTEGSLFDPTAGPTGSWTPVRPPPGWTKIGDAASVVLPNYGPNGILPGGTFMLANCCDYPAQAALFDEEVALNGFLDESPWIVLSPTFGYAGKYDSNNEEGWTLLPDGSVLTVDTFVHAPTNDHVPTIPNNTEIYLAASIETGGPPAGGIWIPAGPTPEPLSDFPGLYLPEICTPPEGNKNEMGPAVLRPDGTVFATGANGCAGKGRCAGQTAAGHTAIYDTESGTWTQTEDIPDCNDMSDAPAALLSDGNVLVQASPGQDMGSSKFYEFEFRTNTFFSGEIPPPPNFNPTNSESGRMLVVASGHVFYMHKSDSTDEMGFYVPKGTYAPSWAPIAFPVNGDCGVNCVVLGHTYTISGTQFNGLSQGAAYGDDSQSATNYPLVRIENCATKHKFFARTHDFPMGVATGLFTVVTTEFDVSPEMETGPSSLVVIANGIPSEPAGGSCATKVIVPQL